MSDSDSTTSNYDWNSDDEPPQDAVGEERTITSDKLVKKKVLVPGNGYNRPGRSDKVLVRIGPSEAELRPEKWIRLGKGKLSCAAEIGIRQMRVDEISVITYPESGVYGGPTPPTFNRFKHYKPVANENDEPNEKPADIVSIDTCIHLIDFKSLRRLTDEGNIIKEVVVKGERGRRPADDDFVSYDVLDKNLDISESVERVKIRSLPFEINRGLRSMQPHEVAKFSIDEERDLFLRLKGFSRLAVTDGLTKLELVPPPEAYMRKRGDVDDMNILIAVSIKEGDKVGFNINWDPPHFFSFYTSTGTVPASIEKCVRTMALLEEACFELKHIEQPLFNDRPPEVPPPLRDLSNWRELIEFAMPIWDGRGPLIPDNVPTEDWTDVGTPCVFPQVPDGPCVVRLWLLGIREPEETYSMDNEARAKYIARMRKVANAYVEQKMYAEAQSCYERALDALRFEVAELFELRDAKNVIRALPNKDPPSPEQVNLYVILHCNLAFCATNRENYHEAKDMANSALQKDMNCVKALFRRGLAYEGMGDWSQALSDFGRLLTLAPKDATVQKAINRLQTAMDREKTKDTVMFKKMFV